MTLSSRRSAADTKTREAAVAQPPDSSGRRTGPDPAGAPHAVAQVAPGELARRARAGDAAAFGELHLRFAPVVHALLLARVPASETEDLVQEVFLAAWRGMDGLRADEHVGTWLCGIARNLANRRHERARPALQPLPEELIGEEGTNAEQEACEERAERILAALRALPAAYAETLALRLVEGLGGPAIAAATGLTEGSVRVNLTRGMKLLRQRLRRAGAEEEPE